jgi:hypothetical protein
MSHFLLPAHHVCHNLRGLLINLATPLEVVAQLVSAVEGHVATGKSANESRRAVLFHVTAAVTSATKSLAAAIGAGDTIAWS